MVPGASVCACGGPCFSAPYHKRNTLTFYRNKVFQWCNTLLSFVLKRTCPPLVYALKLHVLPYFFLTSNAR